MALRRRLVLLAAGTVGATVLLAALACYFAMRLELRGQVDHALRDQREVLRSVPLRNGRPPRTLPTRGKPGESAGAVQILDRRGRVTMGSDKTLDLPVTAADRRIASTERGSLLADRRAGPTHLRVLTFAVPGVGAVQIARSLESTDTTLTRLRYVLAFLLVTGTAFSVGVTRVFARRVTAPVSDLTDAAEHVTATKDLTRRVAVTGDDEVGRMARQFNAMLATMHSWQSALATSVAAQRQLVADASHELRTPITSLRTNIELLLQVEDLDPEERRRMLDDVREQSRDLSSLINDVIDLARGDEHLEHPEEVRLDEIVLDVLERAQRHAPKVGFVADLEPTPVSGMPDRLARAVMNLLDNAAKHTTPGSAVTIILRDGVLSVRDLGPGVPDEDKPHVFDRFYRGDTARGRPGSGLGLAIVRQTVEAHGGWVDVQDAHGGGALFRLSLPVTAAPGDTHREPARLR